MEKEIRKMNNPYEVLGVKENATEEEVKAAYRALVKKYHPDKYQNNPLADLAEEKLREVNKAYDQIMKNGFKSSGSSYSYGGNSSSYSYGNNGGYNSGSRDPQFDAIRQEIDRNNLGAAEAMLNRINVKNAEWVFLSGMVSYKKGWYDDAMSKIQQACHMEPNNQEYRRALNTMMGTNQGYRNTAMGRGYSSTNDAFCQALQCYCCMDFCCDCI
jgi:molecular chaperone DnaJ